MGKKAGLGREGENRAANYLIQNNYQIIERNWRFKHLEIDIIAKCEDTLVFVEVKTRSSQTFCDPIESITSKKKYNLARAAQAYMQFVNYNQEIRFDIILIVSNSQKNTYEIEHIEDAFWFH